MMSSIEKFEKLGPVFSAKISSLLRRFPGYAEYILARIPKDLKSSHLSLATLTAFLGYITYLVTFKYYQLNLPREWHNIPLLSSWQYSRDFLSFKLTHSQRYNRYTKSILDEYGIMRSRVLGTNSLVLASPEYAKELLSRPEAFPKLDSIKRGGLGFKFLGVSVVFSSGDIWLRHRKITSPAFHRSWDPAIFGECAITLFEQIVRQGDGGNKSVEIETLSQNLALDALGKAAFGFNLDSLSNPKNNVYLNAYNKAFKAYANPFYYLLPFLDKPWGSRAKDYMAIDELDAFFFDLIDKKKACLKAEGVPDKNKADLLTLMIQATETEDDGANKFTIRELRDNMLTFFLAGHDTTATALSCAIYYLAKHPEKQEKARREVINVFGDQPTDYIPTLEEIQNLPYIAMIIKETMRLSPGVSDFPRRTAFRDTTIGPYFIPAGMHIQLNVYALHHNPKYWGLDVEEFKPERWEDGTLEKRDVYTYIPFSYGSRACMGTNFSLIEQRVVLSMLLRRFAWSLPTNSLHKNELQYSPGIILHPSHLNINFKSRY